MPSAPGTRRQGSRLQDEQGLWLDDLSSAQGRLLLAPDHPEIQAALLAMIDRGSPDAAATEEGIEVAWLLRELFPAAERVSLHGSGAAARNLAVRLARHHTGRSCIIEMTSQPGVEGPSLRVPPGDMASLEKALRANRGEVAALLIEPVTPGVLSTTDLKTARQLADEAQALLVFDECTTAFRLAPRSVQAMVGVTADLTCVGEALATGLSFGALLGRAELLDRLHEAGIAPSLGGDPLALAAAHATLHLLGKNAVADRIREIGERLRRTFEKACAEHGVRGALFGPAGRMDLFFKEQENAGPELIRQTFQDELRRRGVLAGPVFCPHAAMQAAELRRAEDGIRAAMARLRTLMIEHNSYISGGLRWVFPGGNEVMAARGLAIYRYPKNAGAEVTALEGRIRIAFEPGELGPVTSSGFYVPTPLRGDFSAVVCYRIGTWRPGAKAANLALFAQDELSERRYYAQRRAAGPRAEDHELLATLAGRIGRPAPVRSAKGSLRVMRQGKKITAWHRGEGDWTLLGERLEDQTRDMIIGAKVWGIDWCGGLEAELFDLEIEGQIAQRELPPVDVRPDPRAARAS